MKLLLFDIDGTLMLSGGAGFRAMERAIEQRYGVTGATEGVVPDGKTDLLILREVLRASGLAVGDEERAMRELMTMYEGYLAEEMPTSPAVLMPGVPELLETLSVVDGILLGLLTGNFEHTARIKLDRFDLNRFFPFGAYGSDHEDRIRLPAVAVARAETHSGRPIGLGRHVHVIGDTPLDVACALANDATAVGVANHRFSVEELEAAGAHIVFPDLTDTAAVVAALTG
jgi:phosphoglycolate phosphatase-like HAD superfamily hydrolase